VLTSHFTLHAGVGVLVGVGVPVGVAVGGTGVSVGVAVGVAVGGIDVSVGGTDVAVGSAGTPPHPASNNTTNANPIICCNSFLLLIAPLLSSLKANVLPCLKPSDRPEGAEG